MSITQSMKNSRERSPKRGVVGLVVVILAILLPIGFILTSNPPVDDSIRLDFNLLINSIPNEGQYEAEYNYLANAVYHDVEGTHVQWDNQYSDGTVASSGDFSDVMFTKIYHIYIDSTELVIYANSTWTLSISLISYGFTFALMIMGTSTTIIEIIPSFKDIWFTSSSLAAFQEDLGVDELLMICDIEFHIAGSLLEQEFLNQQTGTQDFTDLVSVLNNYTMGTIPLH